MAVASAAQCADDGRKTAKPQLHPIGLSAWAPRFPTIFVVVCAMGVTGCARNPAPRDLEVRNPPQRVVRVVPVAPVRVAARVHVRSEQRHQTELHVRRPDPALLAPQPAPDCEFRRTDLKAVDPDEWARLRVEYERQCYQDAEQAARERLSRLQAYLRD
jgi:hypothetical protein